MLSIAQVTNILQRVNALGCLFNLTTDDFRNQLRGELSQGAADCLALHDLSHLLADSTDLRRAGIGSFLDLVRASLGEGNGEEADKVVIGSLHSHIGLDECLPLANKRAQLVGREVQAMEIGKAVFPLDLIDTELDFAESVVLIVLQISEGCLKDTASEGVVRILQTAGAVDNRLSNTSHTQLAILSGRSVVA